MPKDETTKDKPTKQAKVRDITASRFSYNVKQIEEFLDVVFHAKDPDEGNVLTWFSTKGSPGYPISEEALSKRLERSANPAALYFGTSTTDIDPVDDRLYNRKALFRSFHVLVLDDIGTKVPFDKIPETFDPTYKIETSEGNWQYGYVLEEPLTDEIQATTLVQLAYDAGLSDAGGKMATKLVRLPGGINGKAGAAGQFQVRLEDMDGPFWTPEDILEEINVGVTWKDVVTDADAVMKARAITTIGTSAWSPIQAQMPTLSGIIDPVLEWLYTEKMVVQELGEWVTIKCPQCDMHSAGGDLTAGYSPMGWGGPAYMNMRIFHCFHDSCKGYKPSDFLKYVANADGPEVPVSEQAMDLIRNYAMSGTKDGVWHITGGSPSFVPMTVFRNLHPDAVWVYRKGDDKPKQVAETRLFVTSKARVTVKHEVYDPTTPARIIQTQKGNMLNMYEPPEWGDGDYNQTDVDMFENFIDYLIPNADSREFFLDWLGAKMQDMSFRGPAILMIAMAQGTGRTTLGNMITQMMGIANVAKKPFNDIVSTQRFNSWMAKSLIITDETLAVDDGASFYRAAERLKERIDTTPTPMTIELKGRDEYTQMNYSSYLLFSNHQGAMRLGDNDRRFYVLDNPEVPASPEYFRKLNQWLEDGTWAKSVFRWLRQRDVDVDELLKPVEMTEAKQEMMAATKQPIDVAIEAILQAWPCNLIAQCQVTQILMRGSLAVRLDMIDEHKLKRVIHTVFRQQVLKLRMEEGVRNAFLTGGVHGVALWVPRCKVNDDVSVKFINHSAQRIDIEVERGKMPEDYTDIIDAVCATLEQHDF